MRTRLIISILIVFCVTGTVYSADLSPAELKAVLERADGQAFDARDEANKPVGTEAEEINGIFRFVERIQSLKAQLETPTVFGTVLTKNNAVSENIDSTEKSNVVIPVKTGKTAQFMAIANSTRKRWLLSFLPVQAMPAGLSTIAISFLISILGMGTCLSIPEPGLRFRVQRE